jgi:hypothetical protein
MNITVDGINYVSKPARKAFDNYFSPNAQSCTGCDGQQSIELCDKLQRCWKDKIIWVREDEEKALTTH